MRILSITAGAAQMYCGSCLRDNALAAELLSRGHDVTLLPFYTPTLTDEKNVSRQARVFFGGISVYLEQHLAPFRHTPQWLHRVLDAPGVISAFTKKSIAVAPKALGALTVSTLRGEAGHQRREIDQLVTWVTSEPPPELVNIPYTLLIALAAPLRRALRCPVVVTLQGEDLFLEGLPQPYKDEALNLIRAQVADVDLFIAVSHYYADFMRDYLNIPASKLRVVPLGISLRDVPEAAPLRRDPFTVGYFARVAPEKGLHVLAQAYRILRQDLGVPHARLRAGGYLPPEQKSYLHTIERRLDASGLHGELEYIGAVDRQAKFAFLRTMDVLSVPSPYREPKGLYALEAMACGVPVVQPAHGAFPEILRRTGGGLLADSDSPADIAARLHEIYRDPDLGRELGRRGHAGVREHYDIRHMADAVLKVYRELL